jgi:biopolymer transport protein ExbD
LTRRRRRPEINIVPLIDISVKLIFFFLVSMQFRETSALNLTLPTSETAGEMRTEQLLMISIDREGRFDVRGSIVPRENLRETLRPHLAENLTVLIRADRDTPVQAVVDAMDACRASGLNSIRFQTQ